jgi:hypothetical protein
MTTDAAFSAFSRVEFHSVFELQQVWMDRPADHLPLQRRALERFADTLQRARNLEDGINPRGLCLVGPPVPERRICWVRSGEKPAGRELTLCSAI